MTITTRPVTVYAESTPNPAAMKFVANIMLIGNEAGVHCSNKVEAEKKSPLAEKLFEFPFVTDIFIAGNFITLTKNGLVHWEDVMLQLREFLKNYLAEGHSVITETSVTATQFEDIQNTIASRHASPSTESEQKIIDVLDQYVRPAVEQDGGLITFKSFKEGVVTLELQGSCKGCPSAALTLKAGIEGLLKKLVPEVQEVVSEVM